MCKVRLFWNVGKTLLGCRSPCPLHPAPSNSTACRPSRGLPASPGGRYSSSGRAGLSTAPLRRGAVEAVSRRLPTAGKQARVGAMVSAHSTHFQFSFNTLQMRYSADETNDTFKAKVFIS